MEKFTKQGWEEFTIAGDFSVNMDADETIILGTSSVVAVDEADQDVTATVLNAATLAVNGQTLTVLVRAGEEADSPYKITFKAVTSNDHRWELDVQMSIKEI